jgi:hypothetical protein
MPTLTRKERSIAAKFERYERLRARGKRLYEAADSLTLEIARQVKPDPLASVRIAEDGTLLEVKNNAAGDDITLGWGHSAVRRYELKVRQP